MGDWTGYGVGRACRGHTLNRNQQVDDTCYHVLVSCVDSEVESVLTQIHLTLVFKPVLLQLKFSGKY